MTHFVDGYNLPDCTVLRRERDRLGYIAGHTDALRRLRAGERQERCARCQRYAWPDSRRACEDFTPDEPVAIHKRVNDENDASLRSVVAMTKEKHVPKKKSLFVELEAEYSETLSQQRAQEAEAQLARPRPAPIAPVELPDLSAQVAQLAAAWGLKRKRS